MEIEIGYTNEYKENDQAKKNNILEKILII